MNTLGFTYVYFKRPEVSDYVEDIDNAHSTSQCIAVTARFACSLHYTAKELDPITNEPEDIGYEDDYVLEDGKSPSQTSLLKQIMKSTNVTREIAVNERLVS